MNNKIYLCSFASNDLNISVKRFQSQAKSINIYSNIRIYRPNDLSDGLINRINKIIKLKGNYLFGHSVWKSALILEHLNKIEEGSILQYSDIGCHLNKRGIKKLIEYINLAKKYKMLAFDYSEPPEEIKKFNYNFQINKEFIFTKGDVFEYFNLNKDSYIYHSSHLWSGTFFLSKSNFCLKIIESWNKACENLHLLDNSSSIKQKNHPEHIGMRGEQSLFSIICKMHNVRTLSASECEWAEGKDGSGRKWDHLENYPILAKRDLKYGIIKRFINRQKKNFKRLKRKLFDK